MLNDAPAAASACGPWIARGALVAVDDAGAGFTSLEYVADIRPDFLKLSRGMVAGVDQDPSRAGGPARDRRVRARGRRADRRRGRRARRGAGDAARDGHRPRPGLAVRPPGRAVAAGRDAPRAADRTAPRAVRARRSRLRARPRRGAARAREAGEVVLDHLARRGLLPSVYLEQGGPPALPGGARRLAGLRRHAADGGHRRARRSARARPRSSTTSARRPTTCPPSPACGRGLASRCASRGHVVGVLERRVARPRLDAGIVERDRALRGAAVARGWKSSSRRTPPRRPSGSRAPRSPGARSRTPRASCARRSPPRWSSRASSRRWSRWPTATARCTRTSPRARSRSPSAGSPPTSSARSRAGSTTGPRATRRRPAGRGFVGHEVAAPAGAGALIVLPLLAAGERARPARPGRPREPSCLRPSTSSCSSCWRCIGRGGLRMAAAVVAAARARVARPADRPGHHGTFLAAIPAVRAGTRRRVALMMVDVDGFNDDQRHARPGGRRRRPARARRAAAGAAPAGGRAFRIGGDEFALVSRSTTRRAPSGSAGTCVRRPRAARHDPLGRRRARPRPARPTTR